MYSLYITYMNSVLLGECLWLEMDEIYSIAEWLERLTVNAEVANVLGSIPASSDTAESERRQMKQC